MLFNSYTFFVFFLFVFTLFWLPLNKYRLVWQNVIILIAGYVFYGSWDWRFLSLIFLTSLSSWISGLLIERTSKPKLVSAINIIFNIGILVCFKYFNFFIDGFVSLLTLFGIQMGRETLDIILPVGISFYTFQALSYSIDVYRGKIKACSDPIRFFAFVSFFPALVAGPIERAQNLLPQFGEAKKFEYHNGIEGVFRVLYGLFLKIVIADRLAVFVNGSWNNTDKLSSVPTIISVVFFAFQLYLDFAAYSEIAKGIGKLLGFEVVTNFKRPYLSRSFKEFWKRWHISLSSWFMDYVYIPIGGNRKGEARRIINLMIVFFLSGLWHGASLTFVLWGILNGFFVVVFDRIFKAGKGINSFIVFISWSLSLILFRAPDVNSVTEFTKHLFEYNGIDMLGEFGLCVRELIFAISLIIGLVIWEMIQEKWGGKLLRWIEKRSFLFYYITAVLILMSIILLGRYGIGNDNSFIYFQF